MSEKDAPTKNTLYYGDNLDVLRLHVKDETIDLVYLDPPFKSDQNYNVLFAERNGSQSAAQIRAFEDTWHWGPDADTAYRTVAEGKDHDASKTIEALFKILGTSDMMAYVAMMAPRLVALRRVMKSTASIFLHCDSTASHYLKTLMDGIFGGTNFLNEIIWKRATTVKGNFGQGSRFFGPNTDSILFYRKSEGNFFNPVFKPYSPSYKKTAYRFLEEDTGRRYRLISMIGPGGAAKGNPRYAVMGVTRYWRYSKKRMNELIKVGMVVQTEPGTVPSRKLYLDEGKGVAVQSLWDDVPPLQASDAERVGYPTQKPEALLERIIAATTKTGDVILDPFCGCGTTVAVAQRMKRQWIGIDITHLAIALMKHRLGNEFGRRIKDQYDVVGEPASLPDAVALANEDRYQFQCWALGFFDARPTAPIKKGADRGIDGRLPYFSQLAKGSKRSKAKLEQILFSVKSGHVGVKDIRELCHVVTREKASIGVFVTLEEPTKPMVDEALGEGFYEPTGIDGKKYRRIQICIIEELFNGRTMDCPPFVQAGGSIAVKAAPAARPAPRGRQFKIDDDE